MAPPRQGAAALALRLAGAGWDEIADALGLVSVAVARETVETALEARAWADSAGRERMRAEASARIERLLRSVWGKATNPDGPEHLPAVKVARELVDRLIRLHGLDAPTEVVIHNPTQAELDAWVAAVIGTASADLRALEAPVTGVVDVAAH
jgi:hypothetical protein